MKTFEHRATVKAARILRVDPRDRPFLPDLEGGAVEEMSFRTWEAAAKDVLAGNPLGYLVIHPNGLDGYVPKATFEAEFMEIRTPAPISAEAETPPAKVTVHVTKEPAPPQPVAAVAIPAPPPTEKPAAPTAKPATKAPEPTKPTPAPRGTTRSDRVFDQYAATTLSQKALADALGMSVGSVSGFISLGRARGDTRVAKGDAARKAAKDAPPPPSVRVAAPPAQPAPARAPAPQAAPRPPTPPVKNAVSENARAASATRERVLEHYKATGDYETPMAQKLGVLRATIVMILTEAREAGDPRARLGDIKRRAKERAK